ncbi:bifunctional YncE family protein/alkaline phosphatase family protein [Horticoccus sp. 23ND18S-11]|uniref:bifunctional YncE family protein/alkaline phosphatase family protein n=1 Tax=Horticoccus sp. 23ND18S-11 TaxID=3391832 RepID=UPI0039C95C1E
MKTPAFVVFALTALALSAQEKFDPVRAVSDPGVVVTRQNITPAGVQSIFDGRVYGVAFGPSSSEVWALSATQLVALDWRANRVATSLPIATAGTRRATVRSDDPEINASVAFNGKPGIQGLVVDASGRPYLTAATTGEVRLLTVEQGAIRTVAGKLGAQVTGTIALAARKNAAGQRLAVIPIIAKNVAAVIDVETGRLLASVPTGIAPVGAAINADGTIAYVSNWAGRVAEAGDRTAPTGLAKGADQVVIDERGIASTGTLTKIDLRTLRAVATLRTELHPTALAWDEPRHRLYVANGNSDSVSVVDTRTDTVQPAFALRPFSEVTPGVAPTALAVSADGSTLYVACGGINAVAVLDAARGTMKGLIPTAWYPNGLALSADGTHLAVSTLLGIGSGSKEGKEKRFVHAYRGSISVVPVPDAAQLASYTTAVAENNHMPIRGAAAAASAIRTARPAATAIPVRAGEPSLIEHVVYVVKENRTYDQVFGDMKKGNGDPSLVMFGSKVTPNQHRLADRYVLLDNFYASGGNSGDGHQWITQSNETDYAMWPGWAGRSYPFDGTDPVAYASGGFMWDYALRAKKTVQVFGEFAPRVSRQPGEPTRPELLAQWRAGRTFDTLWQTRSPIPPLDGVLARNFPGYSTQIPDVVRARIFAGEVKKWEAAGRMPNLVFLQLPSDHTNGTSPGSHTPSAMVADNDLALGQVVEALSHSSFWKKMAIFVVEDDAQNGVDHVDGHRTVALAISPYARRNYVDSTFYANPSMAKTIQLILGLPTMSLFDLIANDMRASFQDQPDFTPYVAVEPAQSLDELNPPAKALRGEARKAAEESLTMRFDVPDAAPTERLNRIVWHQVRGWNVPYPEVKHGVFAPLSVDIEDRER